MDHREETRPTVGWYLRLALVDPPVEPEFHGQAHTEDEAARDASAAALDFLRSRGLRARPGTAVRIGADKATVRVFANESATVGDAAAAIAAAVRGKREAAEAHARRSRGPQPANDTPPSSIPREWARILEWLDANADIPQLPGPGPGKEAVTAASASTGVVWHAELVELCQLHNGVDGLLPGMRLLAADEIAAAHRALVGRRRAGAGGRAATDAAGEIAWKFLPQFVPVARGQDHTLFVDTRPGALTGCVTLYMPVDHDTFGPRWHSVSAMLADLARSLETGAPLDRTDRPSIAGRKLTWQPA